MDIKARMSISEHHDESVYFPMEAINKSVLRIRKALIELLKERPFDDIQVKDIVDQAAIARATFYLHFSSKEEVLVNYIDDMFELFFEQVDEAFLDPSNLDESVAKKIFETYQAEPTLSLVLTQESVHPLLLRRFKGYMSRIIGHTTRASPELAIEQELLGFLIDYWAAGSLQLLTRWVGNDFQPNADVMADLFSKLAISGMKALLPSKP